MSGLCSTKTCVQTASGLRQIGNTIKAMYQKARKVGPENQQRSGLKLLTVDSREAPTKTELLYVERSPSFCDPDGTLGTPGVTGRICSKNATRVNSCSTLCCGRGYNEIWFREDADCRCTFKWCCSVHCEKCSRHKWLTLCK